MGDAPHEQAAVRAIWLVPVGRHEFGTATAVECRRKWTAIRPTT